MLLTVSGFWYKEIPMSCGGLSFPPSQNLLHIASKAARIANLTDAEGSTAYGVLTWRVQRQFAGTGAAARMSRHADEGAFVVGCQLTELATTLRGLTAAGPDSRFRFAVVSDVFSSIGRAVGKADSGYGPTPGVIMVLKRALAAHIGAFALFADVLGGIGDLDAALGVAGVNRLLE